MKVEFKCPKCGSSGLEEVMINVTTTSFVNDIEIEDGVANCEYDQVGLDDGEVDHYQCSECGYVLEVNGITIDNLESLAEWLEDHNPDKEWK